jgi:hypothetical protein
MAYSSSSPYFKTPKNIDGYLDILVARPFPWLETDALITINLTYQHRPDLLAYDLYGDSRLWWVFAQRNPDSLINPLLDFVVGKSIRIPTIETLKEALGI